MVLGEKFPLLRYFAGISLGCMLLVAVPMIVVLNHHGATALTKIAEERNVSYAALISNGLWPAFRQFVQQAPDLSPEQLRAASESRQLHGSIVQLMTNTSILKVNVYSPGGDLYFSTEPAQVGVNRFENPGVLAAADGKVSSELTHRDTFDTFEKSLVDRDVLSSYLPILEAGKVVAVFELYSDVTPLVAQVSGHRNMVVVTVGVFGLLLFCLLSYFVWYARVIINRQQTELEENNDTLESRVRERTWEMAVANQVLRSEVAERVRAETELRLAATVFASTGEGVMIADRNQAILAVNQAFTDITGYTADEAIGQTPRLLSSGRQNEMFYLALWQSMASKGRWAGEIWNRRKNGEVFPEWLSLSVVRDDAGEVTHFVGVFSDITALRASQDRLEYLAHHDVLTGLPNRVQLSRHLSASIAQAREGGKGFALLFIDLDHFKHVNDTLGHSLGDRLLHAVGVALQTCLYDSALVARVGGDEFVAVLHLVDDDAGKPAQGKHDAASMAATAVLLALAEPFAVDEHQLYIGASIGIVCYPEGGETADVLLAHADAAMYRAKAQGRNSWCVYGPEMSERSRDRLALGSSLRKAIDEDRLFLEYQPQVDMASGRLVGVEALVRMRHPQLGVIGPARFIELAEEDGTIRRLGLWVLRESCLAMARWQAQGVAVPKVAVNVSVSQLERSDLPEVLAALLAETGLSPDAIEIEITESVIMNADDAIGKLEQLRAQGISLAIDDFGTGYSSLSYLRKLPVQKLKIDRSFFVDLVHQPDAAAVVRGIVGLARNLGMQTVAEGVESSEQLALLRDEGCDLVQGFLISKPLDEKALAEYCEGLPVVLANPAGRASRPAAA